MFYKKKVKKWDDGDSGTFADGTRFRLARVKAPERNRRGASTATRRAAGMTAASRGNVQFKTVAKDKYGRSVGEMRNRYGSINDELIRRGSKQSRR